jgi:hypothetical protein
LYGAIRAGSAWQEAQIRNIAAGVPIKVCPVHREPIRSDVGSPPWQSAHEMPPLPWNYTTVRNRLLPVTRSTWQSKHVFEPSAGG